MECTEERLFKHCTWSFLVLNSSRINFPNNVQNYGKKRLKFFVKRCNFQMVWPGSGTDLGPMQLPVCQVYLDPDGDNIDDAGDDGGHGDDDDGDGDGDSYVG